VRLGCLGADGQQGKQCKHKVKKVNTR
jgi:hypothetical protein